MEKRDNASDEELDDLHAKYTKALTKLFEENKHKYYPDRDMKLVIL